MKLYIKERLSAQVRSSVIIHAFRVAAAWFYFNLAHGLFGRFFTGFESVENSFSESLTGFCTGTRPGKRTLFKRMRRRVASAFEDSVIITRLNRLAAFLLGCSVRMYSTFTVVFGFYTVGMALLKTVIAKTAVDFNCILTGGIIVLVSVPLFFIGKPVSQVLRESFITKYLLIRVIGVPEEKLHTPPVREGARYSAALILGMVFGVATYFISPMKLITAVAVTAAVWVLMNLPEAGIMALIAAAPFVSVFRHPSALLAGGVLVTMISYLLKYLRGKRTMRLGVTGVFVSLFSVMILLGGLVGAGGRESFGQAVIYFVLIQGFCLTVNLIRTRDACRHALIILASSSVISALYGIGQYMFGYAVSGWLDTEMFTYIAGRATSFFDNPNVFASYLILMFPLLLVLFIDLRGFRSKFVTFFAVLASAVCLVWTWSRGAWLGFIVGVILFFLILSYKTLAVLFAGGLTLPLVGMLLPRDVVGRFLSIGSMSDSSTFYRVFTWKGVIRMLREVWLSGIGVGTAAFEQIYPLFAYAGIEAAPHAHNLLMQVLVETGISGFVTFIIVLVLFAQNCFAFIRGSAGVDRMTVAAGLSGVAAILTMGLADNIWYNYRVFFMFWIVIALTVAFINVVRGESEYIYDRMDKDSAEIGIVVD